MRADLGELQKAIRSIGADAWVMYDFRGTNDLAWDILGLSEDAHCTRRWLVIVPAKGRLKKIVHVMERHPLEHVEAEERHYATREEYEVVLREVLAPYKTLAMEYSPMNVLPTISKVDAGTIELIRSFGHEIVTSAELAQRYTAVLTASQLAGAQVAGGQLRDVIFNGFKTIRERLLDGDTVNEFEIQQQILKEFKQMGMKTDDAPIVAIGSNAADPHYAPTITRNRKIERDMVVVIDAWARNSSPGSVYADLTWVGYTSDKVPADVERTFQVVLRARDAALQLVQERFASQQPVYGFEVDRAARAVVAQANLGSNFIHRTGHNITTQIHGPGVNMDDFESHDNRQILPGMCFSIEPGLYFEGTLGLRSEIDVMIMHDGTVEVPSAPMQRSILPLLADEWEQ
jgi:Xaa-Pro dipeptidase